MSSSRANGSASRTNRPRVGLLGATLGTGNLGVDALGMSIVQGLAAAIPNIEILYQSWDLRLPIHIPAGKSTIECEPMAIRRKNSFRHQDGIQQIRRLASLQKILPSSTISKLTLVSRTLRQLLSCDAILDVSAGDSFANIYGDDVFAYQTEVKRLCLDLGIPLVLMPQTYGPFFDDESRGMAADIISRSALVCSREEQGLADVRTLCGERKPQRFARVPDMAFILEPEETPLPPDFQKALERKSPCIALNISGLLYFTQQSFKLADSYRGFCTELLRWALSVPDGYVLLVPHVVAPTFFSQAKKPGVTTQDKTDTSACKDLINSVDERYHSRIGVLPNSNNPAKAKYALKQCDYFVGARMHAFIGASSMCVPGSLLAYSKKAEGLANLLGIGDSVIDLRSDKIEQWIRNIDVQYQRRERTRNHLEARVPKAKEEIHRFFREEIAPLVLGKSPCCNEFGQAEKSSSPATDERKVLN